MTVATPGFTTQIRTGITVNVGASLVFNVVMQAGDPEDEEPRFLLRACEDAARRPMGRQVVGDEEYRYRYAAEQPNNLLWLASESGAGRCSLLLHLAPSDEALSKR